ncbi:site-2 protease family protein [Thermobifida halotolerans]|uniref:Zinc metalloprotease n=1 Tax=Thermobifida halotolerans TaxID=483545 RepID=A0AA97M1F5_9ACTN|nr:site-2 protease family protein [Thermobifida halotolerans]
MGRPFGIPVHVTPSWAVIAILLTLLYQPVVEDTLALGAASYLVALVFAVLLYASVLVHELAHSVVARHYGLPVRRITLYMLGGVSEIEREAEKPGQEFWIAFSGPLLSLVLAAAGFVGYLLAAPDTIVGVLVWQLWVANLLVGVFNLLPGLPLDGGRILRAGVWALTRRSLTGTVAAAWAGRILGAVVVALPFVYSWVLWGTTPGVFAIVWSVLLGTFIWVNASTALRAARVRARLPELAARDLARSTVTVAADTPLAEALRRRAEADAHAVLVVDSAGTPTSLVDNAAAAAVPEERRPWLSAADTARALTPETVLPADIGGQRLLDTVNARPVSQYLLVEPDGRAAGVLYAADVRRAVQAPGR